MFIRWKLIKTWSDKSWTCITIINYFKISEWLRRFLIWVCFIDFSSCLFWQYRSRKNWEFNFMTLQFQLIIFLNFWFQFLLFWFLLFLILWFIIFFFFWYIFLLIILILILFLIYFLRRCIFLYWSSIIFVFKRICFRLLTWWIWRVIWRLILSSICLIVLIWFIHLVK